MGVFRLNGQSKRDWSSIVRSCKASQSPVYPIRDAILAVNHASCPSSQSGCGRRASVRTDSSSRHGKVRTAHVLRYGPPGPLFPRLLPWRRLSSCIWPSVCIAFAWTSGRYVSRAFASSALCGAFQDLGSFLPQPREVHPGPHVALTPDAGRVRRPLDCLHCPDSDQPSVPLREAARCDRILSHRIVFPQPAREPEPVRDPAQTRASHEWTEKKRTLAEGTLILDYICSCGNGHGKLRHDTTSV